MISYCRHCAGYTVHLADGSCVWRNDPNTPHTASQTNERAAGALTPAANPDRPAEATAARTVTVPVPVTLPVHEGRIMCRVDADMCPLLGPGVPYPYCRESGASLLRQCGADRIERVYPHVGCWVQR